MERTLYYDNFAFLMDIDMKTYEYIHKSEKNVKTNIEESANNLRKAFEHEINQIAKDNGMSFFGDEKRIAYVICELKKNNLLPRLNNEKKIKVHSPDPNNQYKLIEDGYDLLRVVGNRGSHEREKNKDIYGKIILNDITLNIALDLFHKLMIKVHNVEYVERYNQSRMFIEDYSVYKAERVPEWDKSGCLWQYKACKVDSEGKVIQYAIIKQFNQKTFKNLLLRNMKLYNEATSLSEKTMPSGLTPMQEITPYNNNNQYYIIAYTFGKEPEKIESILEELNLDERINLCKKILEIFDEMHGYEKPIYHRLLNPDCVYVCKKGSNYIPYIIDFSFAKINSSNETVKAKLPSAKEAKSYGIYCKYLAPEYEKIDMTKIISNDEWRRIDLYALGVLMADVAMGIITAKTIDYEELIDNNIPEEIAERITLLHCEDPMERIEIKQVLEVM